MSGNLNDESVFAVGHGVVVVDLRKCFQKFGLLVHFLILNKVAGHIASDYI
jgi:hypothetical protein